MTLRSEKARASIGRWAYIFVAIVLLASLVLRLDGLYASITVDEPTWRGRSVRFREALLQNRPKNTYQSEHPGVITMWIGTAAIWMTETLDKMATSPFSVLGNWLRVLKDLPITPITLWGRRMVAGITWLGIVLLAVILHRLYGRGPALIATTLLAFDPFFLAHSRVHHLDALLTTFMALAAFAMLGYIRLPRPGLYLVLSGVNAGLAIANKSPGLFLLPWCATVVLANAWYGDPQHRLTRFFQAVAALCIWTLLVCATLLLVWPALRVAPLDTIMRVFKKGIEQGSNPHEWGNYFWGQIRADPGATFYPVAWAFRTTPWVVVGIVALALFAHKAGKSARDSTLLGPSLFILGYALFMTAASKKFDRYLLPVFPFCDVLAAIGLAHLWRSLGNRERWQRLSRAPFLWAALFIATQGALLWPVRPYYLAYYNPLLGGGHLVPRVLLYGWGEALDKAATYLNGIPRASTLHVASHSPDEFKPFFVGHTTQLGSTPSIEPDFFVLYASHVQRHFAADLTIPLQQQYEPEYVVEINGLPYAWIYHNAFFGEEIAEILRYIEDHATMEGDVVILNANAAFRRMYDGPLTIYRITGPARQDFVLTQLRRALTRGRRLWLLDFPDTYEELYQFIERELANRTQRVDYVSAGEISATCYQADEMTRFVACDSDVPLAYQVGASIRLCGYDLSSTFLSPEEPLTLRLYWQCVIPPPGDYKVFTHLIGPDERIHGQLDAKPQGYAAPTSLWQSGEIILDDYVLHLDENAPVGEYHLEVGMYDPITMARLPVIDVQGQPVPDDRVLIKGLVYSPAKQN